MKGGWEKGYTVCTEGGKERCTAGVPKFFQLAYPLRSFSTGRVPPTHNASSEMVKIHEWFINYSLYVFVLPGEVIIIFNLDKQKCSLQSGYNSHTPHYTSILHTIQSITTPHSPSPHHAVTLHITPCSHTTHHTMHSHYTPHHAVTLHTTPCSHTTHHTMQAHYTPRHAITLHTTLILHTAQTSHHTIGILKG